MDMGFCSSQEVAVLALRDARNNINDAITNLLQGDHYIAQLEAKAMQAGGPPDAAKAPAAEVRHPFFHDW